MLLRQHRLECFPDEYVVPLLGFLLHGLLKGLDAIPTVSGGEDLDIEVTCYLENQLPYIRLNGIVQPIFKLVNKQNTVASIGESQGDTERTIHAIAEAI